MTPSKIRAVIVLEKAAWIHRMLDELRSLPLATREEFESDSRNAAAAESYLRRALEALLDLGRHLLAKAAARGVLQYKQIPKALAEHAMISDESATVLVEMAGYRNRLVHFYNEVSPEELYDLCTNRLDEIEMVLDGILAWLRAHPDSLDDAL